MTFIKDLAKHAQVSISTVYHVVNSTRFVGADATACSSRLKSLCVKQCNAQSKKSK
ncbi:MAG: LacI family DNA-binding transcriptional regulator [Thiothrix sp.]|nr:MAG: LacI family DNA-binding transcriptional regulator [Thiothrix sp.]